MEELMALAPQFKDNINKVLQTQIMDLSARSEQAANNQAYDLYINQYAPIFDNAADIILGIHEDVESGVQARYNSARATESASLVLVLIILILAIALTIIAIIMITKAISKPIQEIEIAMDAMSPGDFEHAVITYKSKDELGILAKSIKKTGSEQVSDGAQVLSEGTTEQASAIEELNATITDISDQVSANTENAETLETVVSGVSDVCTTIQKISEASEELFERSDTLKSLIHKFTLKNA